MRICETAHLESPYNFSMQVAAAILRQYAASSLQDADSDASTTLQYLPIQNHY